MQPVLHDVQGEPLVRVDRGGHELQHDAHRLSHLRRHGDRPLLLRSRHQRPERFGLGREARHLFLRTVVRPQRLDLRGQIVAVRVERVERLLARRDVLPQRVDVFLGRVETTTELVGAIEDLGGDVPVEGGLLLSILLPILLRLIAEKISEEGDG